MRVLEFTPILKRIRWGGRRLGTVLGKPLGEHADYAESWEIADHGVDQSIVAVGEFQGWTLRKLIEKKAYELFGSERLCEQFPLLVKFLDANDRLSLQVHPDDALAIEYDPAENGKTEAWVILDAAPASRLYAGLKPGVGREELEAGLRSGAVEPLLHSFEVSPGDCVFIPARTVHAIGEGILLAEIQQTSDVTFRLFDWGRLESDGKPRALHIADGLRAIDFSRGPVDAVEPAVLSRGAGGLLEELVRSEYFVIRRHTLRDGAEAAIEPDERFHVLLVVEGEILLESGGETRTFARGKTALVPAACARDVRLAARGGAVVIDAFVP